MLALPEVEAVFTVGGFSFGGGGANSGLMFTNLKPLVATNRSESISTGNYRQIKTAVCCDPRSENFA